jgi:hypothetical protein
MSVNIGQAHFIEIIFVMPITTQSCVPNVRLGGSAWQNPHNHFDVRNDGFVSTEDYQTLQQWLVENGEGPLPPTKPDGEPFVDVNGDGRADGRDLALLSQYINDGDSVDRNPEECFPVSDFRIERDLIDPSTVTTIKQAASKKSLVPFSNFRPYFRDWFTKELEEASFNDLIKTKDSIVLIDTRLLVTQTASSLPVREQATDGWTNPNSIYDVNADGVVDEEDVNILVDRINQEVDAGRGNEVILPAIRPAGEPFYDVNGDGVLNASDALLVVNYINEAGTDGPPPVSRLISTVVTSAEQQLGSCTEEFPVIGRIKERLGRSEILPMRFVFPTS